MQIQDYASPNLADGNAQIAEYAEVNAAQVTQNGPYATTTLVTGTRRIGSSLVSVFG